MTLPRVCIVTLCLWMAGCASAPAPWELELQSEIIARNARSQEQMDKDQNLEREIRGMGMSLTREPRPSTGATQ